MNYSQRSTTAIGNNWGKLGRRDFLVHSTMLLLSTSLAAMTKAQTPMEPKKGGRFRIGLSHGATTDTLDPATYQDHMMGTLGWAIGNSLTEINAAGEIVGDIAQKWETTSDAKQWTFELKPGLKFHDGRSVTANDVLASYRHHMGDSSKSIAKSSLESIADIKTSGENVIIFELKAGNSDFAYLTSDYHLPVMPANSDGTVDWQSGNRTGPYRLKSWNPGVEVKLERYDTYHRETWFDEIEIYVIADVTARTNALIAGQVDYIDSVDVKTLSALEKMSSIEIDKVTGIGHNVFVMNVTQAPFNDPRVRNALKYAIDRKAIAENVFLGGATPADDNPIAQKIKFAISPEPQHSYDPQKARLLLEEAGVKNLKVELSVAEAAFAGAVDSALIFQQSAKAAGIEINVIREPNDAYWETVWMKKPFTASHWNGRPTVDWMFTLGYAESAEWNETFWKNPRFNELLLSARSELDESKRAAMYAEMQQLLHDDGGLINIVWTTYISAHSKKVGHGEISSNLDVDGMKICSRWWQI